MIVPTRGRVSWYASVVAGALLSAFVPMRVHSQHPPIPAIAITADSTTIEPRVDIHVYGFMPAWWDPAWWPFDRVTLRRNGAVLTSYVSATPYEGGSWIYTADDAVAGLVPGVNTLTATLCSTTTPVQCTADTVTVTYLADSIASGPVPPLAELAQPNDRRLLDACASCATQAATYVLPPMFLNGGAWGVGLAYSTEAAKPVGYLELDVAVPTTAPPQALSVRVFYGGNAVTLSNGYTWATVIGDTGRVRLAAQFDVSGLGTGGHTVQVEVIAYWDGLGSHATTVPARILVRNDQVTPYGSGWRVAGVARIHNDANGLVIADGGTLDNYSLITCVPGPPEHCSYAPPKGTFGTLWQIPVDSTDSTRWTLTVPDGTQSRFNTAGWLTRATDRFGNTSRIEYETVSGVTRVKRMIAAVPPPGGVGAPVEWAATLAYDGSGNLASITLPDGRQSTFTVTGGDLTSIVDPDGVTAFTGTYVGHRLVRMAGRNGAADTVLFNAFGQVTETRTPAVETDGTVRVATTVVSLRTKLLTGQSGSKFSGTVPAVRTDSAFTRVTVPGATTVTTWPHRSGGAWRAAVQAPGEYPKVTTAWFDAQAQPIATVDAEGGRTRLFWDSNGRLIRTVALQLYRSLVTDYGYTRFDQVDSTWLNGGLLAVNRFRGDTLAPDTTWHVSSGTRAFAYDSAGRVRSAWHEWFPHRRDSVAFDSLTGNARVTRRMLGTAVYSRDSVAFDAAGRVASATDALGRTVTYLYDRLNRDTLAVGPLGATSKWKYEDAIGRATFTDAKSQVYVDSANVLGWPVKRRDPRGNSDTYGFDRRGNVVRHTSRNGQSVYFAYDSLNRMVRRIAGSDTATFGYQQSGLWQWARNAYSLDTLFPTNAWQTATTWVTWRGGERFRVEVRTSALDQPDSLTVERTIGSPTWVRAAKWGWNSNYTLQTLTNFGGATSTVSYSMAGLPYMLSNPGHSQAFTRDSLGRITKVQVGTSGSTLSNQFTRTQVYDLLDRVTQEQRVGFSRSVAYDSLGHVGSVTETDTSFAFLYDSLGNRRDAGAQVATGNRLVQFAGADILYDSAGQMVRRARAGVDTLRYTWDALGQLVRVVRWRAGVGADSVTYRYDAWGRRILRDEGGIHGATHYLYNGAQVVMDLTAIRQPMGAYTYLPGLDAPHAVSTFSSTDYYVRDLAGNVAGFANGSGVYAGRYRYTPYGETLVDSAHVVQPLRWQAREWDDKAGLYYFRARYYDPVLGRFISEDPIGLAGGENPYLFAMSDPINGSDPTGLQGRPCNPTSGGVLTGVGQCPGVTILGRRPSSPVWPNGGGLGGPRCLDEMGYDWYPRCDAMPQDGMGTNAGVEPDPGPPLASRTDVCSLPTAEYSVGLSFLAGLGLSAGGVGLEIGFNSAGQIFLRPSANVGFGPSLYAGGDFNFGGGVGRVYRSGWPGSGAVDAFSQGHFGWGGGAVGMSRAVSTDWVTNIRTGGSVGVGAGLTATVGVQGSWTLATRPFVRRGC